MIKLKVSKLEGIVIKEIDFKESSKILTILTRKYGAISVISKGCKKLSSKLRSASLKLTYAYFYVNYKEDKISKEFYYLGRMKATGELNQFVMANTNKTAVEIEWELDTPVREDIYEYITSK